MKDKYKKMYMRCAEAVAEASEAIRKKVGCVIVDDNGIISEGLNGMPPGWSTEKCEDKIYLPSDVGGWVEPAVGRLNNNSRSVSYTQKVHPNQGGFDGRN